MNTGDFLRKIQQVFQNEAEKIALDLGEGQCSSIEAYKFRCGEITGLKTASDMITDQLKQLHEEDDDG